MTSIKWHDSPQEAYTSSSGAGPWFAAFCGLLGIIVGYMLGITT